MQTTRLLTDLPSYCPECETELDGASGSCPACFWDSSKMVSPVDTTIVEERSFSERYGRRPVDVSLANTDDEGMARGRLFLLIAVTALASACGSTGPEAVPPTPSGQP